MMLLKYQSFTLLAIVSAVVASAFSPLASTGSRKSFIQSSAASSSAAVLPPKLLCCAVLNNDYNRKKSKSPKQERRRITELSSSATPEITISSKNDDNDYTEKKVPPITLLAGFLGSGKTTTLQNLLSNKEGMKIGIIVNDVASINIDSKLLSNPNTPLIGSEETVELQNGCACCSLADELLETIQQLTNNGQRDLDHIVIELSGVADPEIVKKNWLGAERMGHPATQLAKFDKVVTLIDSSTFGTDWMTWDTSYDRDGWVDPYSYSGEEKMVPELLSEQIEAADVLIINKIDLAGKDQTKVASNLAKMMNEKAAIFEVNYGNIAVRDVIDTQPLKKDVDSHDNSHSHNHDHSHSNELNGCSDTNCDDPTHNHSHAHDHSEECDDNLTDIHSHSHDHGTCNDPTHDHSHSHEHSTAVDNLGITNFVYKRDRPFHTMRLLGVLNNWPVPVKDELDLDLLVDAANHGVSIDGRSNSSPFIGVLRSKGFCWLAPTRWMGDGHDGWRHDTAMFWSHAGKHFGLTNAGQWWGTVPPEQMKALFVNNQNEYERILREDFVTEEFADRRQEIVFIGANINEGDISELLDKCLCTEDEMEAYKKDLESRQN